MKYLLLILSLSCFCLTGCITPWTKTTGGLLGKAYRYRMDVHTPQKWYMRQINRMMLFTKHGVSLEFILVDSRRWSDTLSSGFTLPKKILLHEIPGIVLGELCAYGEAFNMKITSNEIKDIDHLPCSVVHYSFLSPNSLRMQGIMYCIPFKKSITVLMYAAEQSVYYEKSYQDFLGMISTLTIQYKKYAALPGLEQFIVRRR